MSGHSKKILIAVATYNEIENLPRLVDEIFRHAPHVDLLVIDDNSPDRTGRWCDGKAADDARVRCLHRPSKQGLGTAAIAGMRYALEHGYDYLVNLDADLSHPPRYVPVLLEAMDGGPAPVDVMIGSRYVAGGSIEGWPPARHLMSRAVNLYARLMLRLAVKDCSGSFRCYRVELLGQLDLNVVRSRGYSFYEEILWHLKRAGAQMAETPITFVDRRWGSSKINSREALGALWTIFRLGLRCWLRL